MHMDPDCSRVRLSVRLLACPSSHQSKIFVSVCNMGALVDNLMDALGIQSNLDIKTTFGLWPKRSLLWKWSFYRDTGNFFLFFFFADTQNEFFHLIPRRSLYQGGLKPRFDCISRREKRSARIDVCSHQFDIVPIHDVHPMLLQCDATSQFQMSQDQLLSILYSCHLVLSCKLWLPTQGLRG